MSVLDGLPEDVLAAVKSGKLEDLVDLAQPLATDMLKHMVKEVKALGPLAPVAAQLVEFATKKLIDALRAEYPAAVITKEATFTGFEKA